MSPAGRALVSALLLTAACATAEKTGGDPMRQAEHGLPAATEFADGPDRAAYAAAHAHEAKGDATNGEAARAEWVQAGQGYAALADKPGAAAWRVPLRHRAAELLVRAQRWERAAEVAQGLVADAQASEASKAVGARLAATAALGAATAQVRAGQLERLELGVSAPQKERPPAAAWKRVVEATDAYLARAGADPEARKAPAERRPGPAPAELALVAAEVHYAHGDLDGARRRLEAVMERWPAEAEVLDQAAPLYLATFLLRGDRAGHDAAVDRLHGRVGMEVAKASQPKDREALARVQEALARARAGARFGAAERLLAEGKAAEAAQAFEAVASEPGVEPANALHDAAVAWDRAGEPARAAKVRERILKEHAGTAFAADDALSLAAYRSRSGDHLGAARLYDEFLGRWPESPNRCVALRNVASELELAARLAEAAARFLAFGRDGACAKADPNVAARALVVAGELFEAQAKAAYTGAAALPGVSDPQAQERVTNAKRRLKGL